MFDLWYLPYWKTRVQLTAASTGKYRGMSGKVTGHELSPTGHRSLIVQLDGGPRLGVWPEEVTKLNGVHYVAKA